MQKRAAKVINEDYFNPVLLVKDTLHWKLCTKSLEPLSNLHSRLFSLFSFCYAGYIRVRLSMCIMTALFEEEWPRNLAFQYIINKPFVHSSPDY